VCAVACARDVGVDVEAWDRPRKVVALADRFFSASEAAAVRALPAGLRESLFVRLWTLKEAYVKARGLGLPVALRDASFMIDGAGAIEARFGGGIADDAGAWQFALLAPTVGHCVAVAVASPGEGPLAIELKKATIGAMDGEHDADRR
jgi:4'-phosphopantetheinyl transferase